MLQSLEGRRKPGYGVEGVMTFNTYIFLSPFFPFSLASFPDKIVCISLNNHLTRNTKKKKNPAKQTESLWVKKLCEFSQFFHNIKITIKLLSVYRVFRYYFNFYILYGILTGDCQLIHLSLFVSVLHSTNQGKIQRNLHNILLWKIIHCIHKNKSVIDEAFSYMVISINYYIKMKLPLNKYMNPSFLNTSP